MSFNINPYLLVRAYQKMVLELRLYIRRYGRLHIPEMDTNSLSLFDYESAREREREGG
jgi:hypothetical protein